MLLRKGLALAALCLVLLEAVSAFYLPGVIPHDYQDGETVKLKVNKIDSVRTQLPYAYYDLPFCKPNDIKDSAENLGEILRGDRIENSLYELKMNIEESCKVLCKSTYTKEQMDQFAEKVEDEYRVHWIIDNLPAATRFMTGFSADGKEPTYAYDRGYYLGFKGGSPIVFNRLAKTDVPYINNHLRLVLKYHKHEDPTTPGPDGSRIVGFEVEPFSVKHATRGPWDDKSPKLTTCSPIHPVTSVGNLEPQPVNEAGEIIWTYDVKWEWSDVKWASRWDLYMKMSDDQVHWFSIINSLLVVLFLSGMVAMIMVRALNRDILTYNDLDQEEAREETGWKLVHGDVFRPPRMSNLLSVMIGSGLQITACASIIIFFAVLGFLSPANRGGLMTAMLFVLAFMGCVAGFFSAWNYKSLGGDQWKQNTVLVCIFYPGMSFGLFFLINFFVWHEGSSVAVPFLQLFELILLWGIVYCPLVMLGSFIGFKREPLTFPVRTQQIPRLIPPQPWHLNPTISILLGGIVPFGAVFIELFFILTSVWLHKFYYVFGFLLLVYLILVLTCAEMAIVMCYFHLCSEDYHWWWRSFLVAGSSAFWMFLYSIYYFNAELNITKFVPSVMYFGYNFIICFTFFVLTGTVGYVSCLVFTRIIYAAIKVD
jgi:transmembrane 9 superfamily protein 2/4